MFKAEDTAAPYQTIRRSHVERVSGESVEVRQSAVGSASGSSLSVRQSAVRQVTAEEAALSQSCAGLARGQRLEVHESAALVAVGREVSAERSRVVFLLAPKVSSPLTAAFTLPADFALGFGYVVGRALVRLLGHLRPYHLGGTGRNDETQWLTYN